MRRLALCWDLPRIPSFSASIPDDGKPKGCKGVYSGVNRRTMLMTSAALCGSRVLRGFERQALDGMVRIPAGSFVMGSGRGETARPDGTTHGDTRHTVRLSEFSIGKHLVTNAQNKAFVEDAGGQPEPRHWRNPLFDWAKKANHPVLWVGYEQAISYCRWMSAKTGWNVTLPSEAQWERAARGATKTGDEFDFPWGNQTSADDYKTRLTFNVTCAMANGVARTVDGTEYAHWPFVVDRRGDASMASNFKAVVYERRGMVRRGGTRGLEANHGWRRTHDTGRVLCSGSGGVLRHGGECI